jgi:hypothetical protein
VFKDLMQRSSNYGMYLLITLTLKWSIKRTKVEIKSG